MSPCRRESPPPSADPILPHQDFVARAFEHERISIPGDLVAHDFRAVDIEEQETVPVAPNRIVANNRAVAVADSEPLVSVSFDGIPLDDTVAGISQKVESIVQISCDRVADDAALLRLPKIQTVAIVVGEPACNNTHASRIVAPHTLPIACRRHISDHRGIRFRHEHSDAVVAHREPFDDGARSLFDSQAHRIRVGLFVRVLSLDDRPIATQPRPRLPKLDPHIAIGPGSDHQLIGEDVGVGGRSGERFFAGKSRLANNDPRSRRWAEGLGGCRWLERQASEENGVG